MPVERCTILARGAKPVNPILRYDRLSVLPLHAITAEYGTAGLRARLALETHYATSREDQAKGQLDCATERIARTEGR
jgi:hypothetical protein